MPNQFPLGRFLNKSEYPLSLMQQIAVNKLTKMEEENLSIQSVNGPPGTGKTTLLQDVVAELIVKQAYEICYLEKRVFDDENIDQLNRSITKNSVMVVSSNNGAVQNIVNEWIQTNKIQTKAFIEKLLEIDYFSEIANEEDILKNEFWGLLSCEGGKRTNVNKMLEKLEHIVDNLNKATDHKNVYQDFKDAYEELKNEQNKIHNEAEKYLKYKRHVQKLKNLCNKTIDNSLQQTNEILCKPISNTQNSKQNHRFHKLIEWFSKKKSKQTKELVDDDQYEIENLKKSISDYEQEAKANGVINLLCQKYSY